MLSLGTVDHSKIKKEAALEVEDESDGSPLSPQPIIDVKLFKNEKIEEDDVDAQQVDPYDYPCLSRKPFKVVPGIDTLLVKPLFVGEKVVDGVSEQFLQSLQHELESLLSEVVKTKTTLIDLKEGKKRLADRTSTKVCYARFTRNKLKETANLPTISDIKPDLEFEEDEYKAKKRLFWKFVDTYLPKINYNYVEDIIQMLAPAPGESNAVAKCSQYELFRDYVSNLETAAVNVEGAMDQLKLAMHRLREEGGIRRNMEKFVGICEQNVQSAHLDSLDADIEMDLLNNLSNSNHSNSTTRNINLGQELLIEVGKVQTENADQKKKLESRAMISAKYFELKAELKVLDNGIISIFNNIEAAKKSRQTKDQLMVKLRNVASNLLKSRNAILPQIDEYESILYS